MILPNPLLWAGSPFASRRLGERGHQSDLDELAGQGTSCAANIKSGSRVESASRITTPHLDSKAMDKSSAEAKLETVLPEWFNILQAWSSSGRLAAAAQEALMLNGEPQSLKSLQKNRLAAGSSLRAAAKAQSEPGSVPWLARSGGGSRGFSANS